ncbi:sel1 repeat family protein [Butyrivibrio sp. AE2032]|uniref:sel1 repeat family protein n=1 Tax=Butyrivibrio sp. AE2032 TaxID=1458463 RepID=UPI00054F061D|nr:sel1 repeat family protein [Butyrivibrio sp. AE2032]
MNPEAEQNELKKIFEHYLSLANKRVSWAQTWIADAYFWGWGVEKDYKKFIEWDIKAARNGSYVSKRRMMLYYQSFGDVEAVTDIYRMRFRPTMISKHKAIYPTEIEIAFEERRGEIGYMRWPFEEYKERFANKNAFQFIDDFEASIDNTLLYSELEYGEAALSRAICYIFGFGTAPDLKLAMDYLVGFDNKDWDKLKRAKGSRYTRNDYYSSSFDALHYYSCLREIGIDGSDSLDEFLDEFVHGQLLGSVESAFSAYLVRHELRRALEGDIICAGNIGMCMLEEGNVPDNAGRRLLYHDDLSAAGFLKMVVNKKRNSLVTIKMLELTSDPEKRSFDWSYSYNLCLNVESAFSEINEYLSHEYDISTQLSLRSALVDAFLKLAHSTDNEAVRRNIGKKLLVIDQQDDGIGDLCKGKLYFDCFRDYYQAITYFDRYFGGPNEYSDLCRRLMGVQ